MRKQSDLRLESLRSLKPCSETFEVVALGQARLMHVSHVLASTMEGIWVRLSFYRARSLQ